jgi:hypothetical protein
MFRKEDAKHKLLRCAETKMWRREYLGKKWFNMNEELVYREMINFTNRTQITNVGQHLNRLQSKLENKGTKNS